MIGMRRLDTLQEHMETTLKTSAVTTIECGARRGGATIFMGGVLEAHGVKNRKVLVKAGRNRRPGRRRSSRGPSLLDGQVDAPERLERDIDDFRRKRTSRRPASITWF